MHRVHVAAHDPGLGRNIVGDDQVATLLLQLDAGVFAYAKAGFGNYLGFLSAFGYWIGSCIGNVSYWVLIPCFIYLIFYAFYGYSIRSWSPRLVRASTYP